jgi:predicted GH43/DUF377 family glycosyl hydrolase
MKTESEPPDRRQNISNLETTIQDKKIILLTPSQEEIAVCNPAALNNHFVYRARLKANNGYGEKSVLKYQRQAKPDRLQGSPRTILSPETEYEKDGIEDARLSKLENGDYGLTYVAFNEDAENGGAKIALATTEDFKSIKKHGIIGPEIRYKEAIALAGGPDSYYGEKLSRQLREIQKTHKDLNPFVMDKDASLTYNPNSKEYVLFHRVDPGIQIAKAKSIQDFQDQDFWRHQFKTLEANTILYPGTRSSSENWASEKVGLGGTPRQIGSTLLCHIHGVEANISDKKETYTYKGTFAELDRKTYKIISILRTPLLIPHKDEYVFREKAEEKQIEKYVDFPTEIVARGNSLWNYSGIGDQVIQARSTNLKWLLKELSHPHNQINQWHGQQ